MKKTLKKLQPLLLVVLLAFTCCQQDDVHMNDSNASSTFKSRTITYKELKAMPKAMSALEHLKQQRLKKSVYSERYDFTVDTTDVTLIEMDNNYHSLTFTISRDSTYAPAIENLVLNWEPYEDYRAFLTTYTLSDEEIDKIANGEYVDLENKETIKLLPLFDTAAIKPKSDTGDDEGQIIKIDGTYYQETLDRATDYSNFPELRETSVWVIKSFPVTYTDNGYSGFEEPKVFDTPYPIPTGPIADLQGTAPGGGGGSTKPTPHHPVLTKPQIIANRAQCNKIKDALNGNTYITNLEGLASLVNDPDEYGSGLDSSGNVTYFIAGDVVKIVPPPAGTTYTIVSHTHDAGKLSVFSFDDLEGFAKLLNNNQIDTDTFVATLSTQKGTHYVLTISTPIKFKDFFYHKFHDFMTLPQTDENTYRNKYKKVDDLKRKYYSGETRLISENNSNNTAVLQQFLAFLKEADMGVNLFETDATFQNFEEVTLKADGSIKRSACK
ncbi:hypothetical protein GWA97_00300 [Flavobacterium sp. LaA7.5]|nr:hypothetical protein [Flavobacterium salilacus subsp. altitudinum]